MSEYQYYEFRAIDRPLDEDEMDELRDLSSRAEITPTSFTNTYNYGDFRGNPTALMERYFDAFVYVANWGTRRLMFRIHRRFLDVEMASFYCEERSLEVTSKKQHVLIEFCTEDEDGGDWVDGEPWMPSLITLRSDLLRGDYRALYIGWLASLQSLDRDEDDEDDERFEPPVPPGLGKLSAPLKDLAEFLEVDDELIEVAAEGSVGLAPAEPSVADLAGWLKKRPAAEKDAYLLRVMADGGDPLLSAEMLKRYRDANTPKSLKAAAKSRRTVAQLLASWDELIERRNREKAELAKKERVKQEKKRAEERAQRLEELARREPAAWREVDNLIATKIPKDYDRAVALLVDLRALAEKGGRQAEADNRIKTLREVHRKKTTLLERFDKAKLAK